MACIIDDGRTVYYMALHSRVLVAYVLCEPTKTYKAYIYPVPGLSHQNEACDWSTEGEYLNSTQAAGLWGGLTEQLATDGYTYGR